MQEGGIMPTIRLPIIASFLAMFVAQAGFNLAEAACTVAEKPYKLKFKVQGDQCVTRVLKDEDGSDAETINVCEGDTVIWSITGPKKSVVFDNADSPFEWKDSDFKGNKIEGVVKAGAAKDGKATTYKYTVRVEGKACAHDPIIIVDR
jgi:hypothetical protein